MRSTRRCGVCLAAVDRRVEAAGLVNTGVLKDSGTLDSSLAFTAQDDTCSFSHWSSSALTVLVCERVCSTISSLLLEPSSSTTCLSAGSNCRNPNASLLYLTSSAPRLGPETCTRISIDGAIVSLHLEEMSVVQVSRYLYVAM